MASAFDFIINLLINYWWMIALVILFVMFINYYMKSKDDFKLPRKPLKEIYDQEMRDQIQVTGFKSNRRYLRKGLVNLGRVRKVADINWTFTPTKKDKLEPKGMKFLQIAVTQEDFISKLMYMFGKGVKYFLIDKEFIKKDFEHMPTDDIIIEDNAQYWNAEGIGIFSQMGKKYTESLAWKKTYFFSLEEMANYIPKQTYLEVRQAKQTEKARMLTQLEKDRWGSQVERAVEEE